MVLSKEEREAQRAAQKEALRQRMLAGRKQAQAENKAGVTQEDSQTAGVILQTLNTERVAGDTQRFLVDERAPVSEDTDGDKGIRPGESSLDVPSNHSAIEQQEIPAQSPRSHRSASRSSSTDSLDIVSWANRSLESARKSRKLSAKARGKQKAKDEPSLDLDSSNSSASLGALIDDVDSSDIDLDESIEEAAERSGVMDDEEEPIGSPPHPLEGQLLRPMDDFTNYNLLASSSQYDLHKPGSSSTSSPFIPNYTSSDEEEFDLSLDSAQALASVRRRHASSRLSTASASTQSSQQRFPSPRLSLGSNGHLDALGLPMARQASNTTSSQSSYRFPATVPRNMGLKLPPVTAALPQRKSSLPAPHDSAEILSDDSFARSPLSTKGPLSPSPLGLQKARPASILPRVTRTGIKSPPMLSRIPTSPPESKVKTGKRHAKNESVVTVSSLGSSAASSDASGDRSQPISSKFPMPSPTLSHDSYGSNSKTNSTSRPLSPLSAFSGDSGYRTARSRQSTASSLGLPSSNRLSLAPADGPRKPSLPSRLMPPSRTSSPSSSSLPRRAGVGTSSLPVPSNTQRRVSAIPLPKASK